MEATGSLDPFPWPFLSKSPNSHLVPFSPHCSDPCPASSPYPHPQKAEFTASVLGEGPCLTDPSLWAETPCPPGIPPDQLFTVPLSSQCLLAPVISHQVPGHTMPSTSASLLATWSNTQAWPYTVQGVFCFLHPIFSFFPAGLISHCFVSYLASLLQPLSSALPSPFSGLSKSQSLFALGLCSPASLFLCLQHTPFLSLSLSSLTSSSAVSTLRIRSIPPWTEGINSRRRLG